MPSVSHILADEAATMRAGEAIARAVTQLPDAVQLHVNLVGDLGAGKTTLVRGVLRGLGYAGRVKSPTYPILETYQVDSISLSHFDLYRLETPEAFTEAGFEDCFAGPGLRFVEWPDRAEDRLPVADWSLLLQDHPEGGRQLTITALTTRGTRCLANLIL